LPQFFNFCSYVQRHDGFAIDEGGRCLSLGQCRLLHYPTFLVGNRTRALAFEITALHVAVTLRRFGSPVRP
jgi:hypothetical protein